jgi:superfamily II DNA or RNA helicase
MTAVSESIPVAPPRRRRGYWQAEGLIVERLSRFQQATTLGDPVLQRRAFYRLANYYGRTLHILNGALSARNEDLAHAALHNLLALHRALYHMHRSAPDVVPLPLPFHLDDRNEFVRDILMRVLAESPNPLETKAIAERVNHLHMLGRVPHTAVRDHLTDLEATGHVLAERGSYRRSQRPYVELDMDVIGLRAVSGPTIHGTLALRGFPGLRDVDGRPRTFVSELNATARLERAETGQLFVEACRTILGTTIGESSAWRYADMIHGPYPRPYQREAFVAFRHGDYRNLLIEAPTGSGKTLIGMMCIQDWLRAMQSGQSILVLVPTSNYQQQWIDELCYHDIGLKLSPEIIFSGTPGQFDQFVAHTGEHPALVLLTYTALAQLGSPKGKGGFDAQSVERFLQEANVQYVILDEVHKVVENMHSVTTDVTRLLSEWLQDTSLRGLVGFSGTAEGYRSRFDELGLELVHSIPMDDLVAAGFVAPFAELGVPFSNSTREKQIRDRLEAYKDGLRAYFDLLGPQQLRLWFAQVPLEERLEIGHEMLGMYRGRRDWRPALEKRFAAWEKGKPDAMAITEIRLVNILQIARDWSDAEMVRQAGADQEQFDALVARLNIIRQELQDLIYLPTTLVRLQADGFAHQFDAAAVRQVAATVRASDRVEAVKDVLSSSIAGLYDGLSEWYLRVGEGRVETVKAIIEAERAVRDVSGIIVFDRGRHIRWKDEVAIPGYVGLAGLFAEMLGDPRFTSLAVLSNEMYLSYDQADPLPPRIADYVEQSLMRHEVGDAIFNLVVQGLDLPDDAVAQLRQRFTTDLDGYLSRVRRAHSARYGEFNRRVLRPVRKLVRKLNLGLPGERALARLDRRNAHLQGLVRTFFDYALIARHFREAHVGQLEQVSGARQRFFVVTMPGGSQRKQLMYDLTSRIVDEESLQVNLVIVSNWARTGWNVIQPNVLIDATATRDLTAWQQLRGRAIRALHSWTNDCYRLLVVLDGHDHLHALTSGGAVEGAQVEHEEPEGDDASLDADLMALLKTVAPEETFERVQSQGDGNGWGVQVLSAAEREGLAMRLVQSRNKVTHIYEMFKAYGSSSQVTYNRSQRAWERREAIAAKHEQEVAVNPFTGEKTAGIEHAPLVYASDPRTDLPVDLQEHLIKAIAGSDEIIVRGWMESEHTV